MIEAFYWWDEAEKFKDEARASADPRRQQELLELAGVCEAVAAEAEERTTGG